MEQMSATPHTREQAIAALVPVCRAMLTEGMELVDLVGKQAKAFATANITIEGNVQDVWAAVLCEIAMKLTVQPQEPNAVTLDATADTPQVLSITKETRKAVKGVLRAVAKLNARSQDMAARQVENAKSDILERIEALQAMALTGELRGTLERVMTILNTVHGNPKLPNPKRIPSTETPDFGIRGKVARTSGQTPALPRKFWEKSTSRLHNPFGQENAQL